MSVSLSKEDRLEKELFYLFARPVLLDGSKWARTFGEPDPTSYEAGLRRTVDWWRRELGDPAPSPGTRT